MDLGLKDRVALITGSSRGLGKASALALAREGARVVLNGRTAATLEAAAAELRAASTDQAVVTVAADVSTEAGCQHLFDAAHHAFGQVDILVNNAGGGSRANLAAADGDWSVPLDQMFWSALRLSRLVAPGMRARRQGVIVTISSIFGREL